MKLFLALLVLALAGCCSQPVKREAIRVDELNRESQRALQMKARYPSKSPTD